MKSKSVEVLGEIIRICLDVDRKIRGVPVAKWGGADVDAEKTLRAMGFSQIEEIIKGVIEKQQKGD